MFTHYARVLLVKLARVTAIVAVTAAVMSSAAVPVYSGQSSVPGVGTRATFASSAASTSAVVYFVGDSITAGGGIAANAIWRDSYPHRAANLICGFQCPQAHIVGHGGQCLVVTVCAYGPNLLTTFQPEVLNATPAPTSVLVEIGVNDIGNASLAQLEAGYQQLAAWCAAAGVRFTVGTITPQNSHYYQWANWYWVDQLRQLVNAWLRTTYGTAVADFDAVLRAPSADTLDPAYDSGDGLHPNYLGAMRMADMTAGLAFT